jgi:hypothetical protein
MNCWEALLFIAYLSGAVSKGWLIEIHESATNAARGGWYRAKVDAQVSDRQAKKEASDAYFKKLKDSIVGGDVTEIRRDPETRLTMPDIPRGHLVSFNGLGHVALALGTRDAEGRQEVLSHWHFPHNYKWVGGQELGPGFLQKTTVEKLMEIFHHVSSGPPPWPAYDDNPVH